MTPQLKNLYNDFTIACDKVKMFQTKHQTRSSYLEQAEALTCLNRGIYDPKVIKYRTDGVKDRDVKLNDYYSAYVYWRDEQVRLFTQIKVVEKMEGYTINVESTETFLAHI